MLPQSVLNDLWNVIQTNTLLDINLNGGRITHTGSCFHRMKGRNCWMEDAWISSGFGERAGRIVPTILQTMITFEMGMIIMWLVALVRWTLKWWWMVCETKRGSHVPLLQSSMICKSSNVYSWERDEESTSLDCDVSLIVECPWKIHIGETGHI